VIARSIPRGSDGCPYIFILPQKDDEEGLTSLVEEIRRLEFEVIVGVDAGGDSLTGGCDKDQRDEEMLRVLQRVGVPCYHLVVSIFFFAFLWG